MNCQLHSTDYKQNLLSSCSQFAENLVAANRSQLCLLVASVRVQETPRNLLPAQLSDEQQLTQTETIL